MLTIQSLGNIKKHAHLTSHNVFIDIKKLGRNAFELKVRVSDLEVQDFMEYSNMFFNYRISTVWSAPECLAQLKRIVEGNIQMDAYSYGIILWELWHQAIPFDNDVPSAKQYVMEESRP